MKFVYSCAKPGHVEARREQELISCRWKMCKRRAIHDGNQVLPGHTKQRPCSRRLCVVYVGLSTSIYRSHHKHRRRTEDTKAAGVIRTNVWACDHRELYVQRGFREVCNTQCVRTNQRAVPALQLVRLKDDNGRVDERCSCCSLLIRACLESNDLPAAQRHCVRAYTVLER